MQKTIFNLIRFFDKEEYADQLMQGRLRLNRLRYYKRLAGAYGDGRGDYAEAPAAWWQKANFFLELHEYPELNLCPEHLNGPVLLSFPSYDDLHILCLTAIHTGEFDCKNGHLLFQEGDENKLRTQLRLDPRCLKMGRFVVVMRAGDFVLRSKTAIEALGYTFSSTLIDYFDPTIFHGRFPFQEMEFRKRIKFSYQNEYRICVDTHTKGDDVAWIDIGDVSGFAAKMPSEHLNSAFHLQSAVV